MDKRTQTEILWKKCFGDTDEYIRLYFNAKYRDENTYTMGTKEHITSVLQMIPYNIHCQGFNLSAGYIVGACTDPEFRGQGLMRQLLSTSLQSIFYRYKDVSFLIPAEPGLFDYYAQSGFSSQFLQSTESHHIETFLNTSVRILDLTDAQSPQIFDFYKKTAFSRNGVIHTAFDFNDIMAEHYLSGGKLLLLGTIDSPRAIALALSDNNSVRISELIATDENDKVAFINEATQLYNQHTVNIIVPGEGTPHAMIRIVNALNTLQKYASVHPNIQQTIHIEDPIISENSGTYEINNGKCSRTTHSTPGSVWSIADLAEFVFHKSLFINLMLD